MQKMKRIINRGDFNKCHAVREETVSAHKPGIGIKRKLKIA